MVLIVTVFVLVTGKVYLLLQRFMARAVFGFGLLSHTINLILFVTNVPGQRTEPITNSTNTVVVADPLPQVFVLATIVIVLAMSIPMLATAAIGCNDNMLRHPETGEVHCA